MPITNETVTDTPPIKPESGPGSQTPLDMDKTPASIGGPSTIKPQGAPGAPAGNMNAGGGAPAPAGGAKPQPGNPAQQQAPISPEDQARYTKDEPQFLSEVKEGIDYLMREANDGKDPEEKGSIEDLSFEDVEKLINYLIDIGWDKEHLYKDVLKSSDPEKIKEQLLVLEENQARRDEADSQQRDNSVKQQELNVKQQEQQNKQKEQQIKQPAPTNAPFATAPKPPVPGAPQAPKPQQPGQPQPAPVPNQQAPKPEDQNLGKTSNYNIRGESMSEKIIVSDGTIKTASSDVTEMVNGIFKATKAAELSIEKYRHATLMLEGAKALGEATDEFDVNRLAADVQSKMADLSGKLEDGESLKKSVGSPEEDEKLEKSLDKGKDTLSKGKGLFEKKDKPMEKKDAPKPFEKEEKKEEGLKHEKEESPAKEKAEEAVAKKPAADIFSSIVDKVKKEAQLYPAKDLNKTTVDNTNAENAKSQATTIDSELKKQPDADLKKGPLGMNKDGEKNPSPKFVGKIKKEAFDNGAAKFKLAMEMASQQQLKGILDNPLKLAMVKNMVEAGLDEKTAEAIAFNSFVDGYQSTQELLMKEASAFVKKDHAEFVKIAEATIKAPVLETLETVKSASAEEESSVAFRTASAQSSETSYTQLMREHLAKR